MNCQKVSRSTAIRDFLAGIIREVSLLDGTLRHSGMLSHHSPTVIVTRFEGTAPFSRLQIGKPKFMLDGIGL